MFEVELLLFLPKCFSWLKCGWPEDNDGDSLGWLFSLLTGIFLFFVVVLVRCDDCASSSWFEYLLWTFWQSVRVLFMYFYAQYLMIRNPRSRQHMLKVKPCVEVAFFFGCKLIAFRLLDWPSSLVANSYPQTVELASFFGCKLLPSNCWTRLLLWLQIVSLKLLN